MQYRVCENIRTLCPTTTTTAAAAVTTDAIFAAKSRYISRDTTRSTLSLRGARRPRKNLSESGKIHDDGNIPRMCRAPKIFRLVRDADTRPAESSPSPPSRIDHRSDASPRIDSERPAALETESMDRGSDSPAYARWEAVGHLRARSRSRAEGSSRA